MLGKQDLIAFVGTTDLEKAKRFYEGILGVPLKRMEPWAAVFDANGTMLRVSNVSEVSPAPYTVLGWTVPDIRGAVREFGGRGVTFERFEGFPQDDLGIWTAPDGTQVAWFRDPDGNLLSLTQF